MFAKVPLFLVICSLLGVPALAQDTPDVSVVIVPTKAKGGPNLRRQVRKRIERKLKGKGELGVVPFGVFRKAAKRAGFSGKAVLDRANAVEAGSEAGVTHICYIEGQREKEGRKKYYFAEVFLIEVSSGDVVFTNRYELRGRKINAVIAGTILEELTAALTTPPPPPEPAPVEEPPPPPEPPVEEPVAVAPEPPVEEPPPEPVEPVAMTPGFGDSPAITVSEPVSRRKGKRWRPALHVGLGGVMLYRMADLTSPSGNPPDYDGPLPGATLRVDFFPMAIGGRGAWYEGFGLHVEAQYMRVNTLIDERTQQEATSDVMMGNGGLSYRLVFWDSATAPDFTLKAGYGVFIFPLPGVFPGTRYFSPYAGGHLTIPFMQEIAFVAGGLANFLVDVDGRLKRLGTFDNGIGFRAEAGVRLFFDPFEITAMGRFEQWQTNYTGAATLTGSEGFTNMKLEDMLVGGFVTAGFAF